ncbi:MAG: eukaryotic-like serine/threonine-protein kinase [Gaiellales bacterium]|jgi:serine/threonine-protein kinase|nr:eukaryotic-like serine/threonine-protein kinase [Gaiellales bacterium]
MGVDHIIGELFDGRYRLERRIGAGGMADVYLAQDETLNRRVAIKILADRYTQDDGFVERFRREATAAAGLNHPNIVSIYDRGEAEGTYYIAMEYIEGPTLKEEITSRAPLPEAEAIGYAQQALQALEFAHRRGVIHRDIKPHNMMVTPDGLLKVTDFGIARAANQVEMTEVGSIVGTAQYLSPEQARGQNVGPQSDIYSLGVVLYELLTGEVPFGGSSAVEIAMKQVNEQPVPPSSKNRLISPAVEQVVMRALAKDPALRFRSAREMGDELERVRRGLGVSHDTQQATAVIGAYAAADATRVMGAATGERTAVLPPSSGQPKRSALPWVLVALLLAASIAVGYVVYQQLQGPAGVKVPNVSGAPEASAKQTLQGDGFKVGPSRHKASATIPSGSVISTKPAAGDTAPKGSTVTMVVSTGPKSVKLPDLRGKPLAEALQTLSDLKLPSPAVVNIPSKLTSGTVVRTTPGPGVIDPTTIVTLFVSNGNVKVPNVIGMTCDQATSTLQGFNLTANCVDAPSDTAPAGQVFAQSPSAGQPAPQGGTVDLQVSAGPAQVQVPDVTNTDYGSAKHLLQQQDLHAARQDCLASDPSIPDGVVVASDPPAGTMVDPKSTVTVYVQDSTSTTPCP